MLTFQNKSLNANPVSFLPQLNQKKVETSMRRRLKNGFRSYPMMFLNARRSMNIRENGIL